MSCSSRRSSTPGLTMHYLARSFLLRNPASLTAVTLFDRPYRRLVDDLPVRYVGFTIPDEFFVGYGLRPGRALAEPARSARGQPGRLSRRFAQVLGMANIRV